MSHLTKIKTERFTESDTLLHMKSPELKQFDVKLLRVMAHLCEQDLIDDQILDLIGDIGTDYRLLYDRHNVLEQNLHIDPKTNLLKYRDDYFEQVVKSASRFVDFDSTPSIIISYIRFDLDNFTQLNSLCGHSFGDRVLRDFAEILCENTRPTDYLIRYGGEEFDVMLPGTTLAGAETCIKKIFSKLEKMNYEVNGRSILVTTSAGLTSHAIHSQRLINPDLDQLKQEYELVQKCADDALYHAKYAGKNQYMLYDSSMDYNRIRVAYTAKALESAV